MDVLVQLFCHIALDILQWSNNVSILKENNENLREAYCILLQLSDIYCGALLIWLWVRQGVNDSLPTRAFNGLIISQLQKLKFKAFGYISATEE